jgi:sugar phosphate isomerase/epimerase
LVAACAEANGTGNVYAGIQPRPRRFFDQAPNRLARLRREAHDQDIGHIIALVLDLDPIRPKDSASTDEELERGVDEAKRLAGWLESRHFAKPVRVMSGNRCHLWFAVPPMVVVDDERDALTERLKAFDAKVRVQVTADGVKLDSIYNLSRIVLRCCVQTLTSFPDLPNPARSH